MAGETRELQSGEQRWRLRSWKVGNGSVFNCGKKDRRLGTGEEAKGSNLKTSETFAGASGKMGLLGEPRDVT